MQRSVSKYFWMWSVLLATATGWARDWEQWRGPHRNGISDAPGVNEVWPKDGPPVLWKANVGLGLSSFAVSQGRVFTLGHADENDTVYAFDAMSGKEIWKHTYPSDLGDKYFEGGATGAPVISDGKVFVFSRWGDLFCFEAATGKILWNRNIQKDGEARIPTWGFSGAPTIFGDLLLLNVGESGWALDKKSGKTIWTSPAKDSGYSSPLPYQQGDETLVLFSSGQGFVSVEPQTGKERWRIRWVTQYGVNAADPIVSGGKVFISSGYGKGGALLKLNNSPEPEVLWKSKVIRSQMNAAVLVKDHLYGFDGDNTDKGALKCVEFATGQEKWANAELGLGTLIVVKDRLLILSERGELVLAPVSEKAFAPIVRAQILGGKSWTAPVLANEIVYCRNSRGDVAAVDLRKKN